MPNKPSTISRFRNLPGSVADMRTQIAELYDLVERLRLVVPIGTVIGSLGTGGALPTDYLPCDGIAVPVADYPLLAKACPFMVSSTDSTVLIVPDLRGTFPQFTPPTSGAQAGQVDNQTWEAGTGHSVDNLYLTPFIRAR